MSIFSKKQISSLPRAIRAYLKSGHTKHVRVTGALLIVVFAVFMIGFYAFIQPPRDFPVGTLVSVPKGASISQIAHTLEERQVIKSAPAFTMVAHLPMMGDSVRFGEYYFETPQHVWGVVSRMTSGEFGLDPVRVTIPEGATVAEIGNILDERLPSFPRDRFRNIASGKEGFLFPDTYFFLPNAKPEHIVEAMEKNFRERTKDIRKQLADDERTFEEVINMASIIEKEAILFEDKRLVSGVLWKRIEIGMPLQVDAPFIYSIGKNSFQLSLEDLETDAPYNTYTNRGLPPTPIANPGLKAIKAAANPKESPYLFFLSDLHNNMHYAEDFEEHKRNKRLYLN